MAQRFRPCALGRDEYFHQTRNVTVSGGGGGVSFCFANYGDFEDVIIGGDLTITGWQSCWLGIFRVTIMHNVYFNANTVADPDGNEIANDTILGDLHCSGNSPSTHTGDSSGGPSVVVGNASGQCNGSGATRPLSGDDDRMQRFVPFEALFKGRHFDGQIIILYVRWYTSFKLSLTDLVIMMADRGVTLTRTMILRWVQHYLPEFEKRWSRYARPV